VSAAHHNAICALTQQLLSKLFYTLLERRCTGDHDRNCSCFLALSCMPVHSWSVICSLSLCVRPPFPGFIVNQRKCLDLRPAITAMPLLHNGYLAISLHSRSAVLRMIIESHLLAQRQTIRIHLYYKCKYRLLYSTVVFDYLLPSV
jgi:hypothetical protein